MKMRLAVGLLLGTAVSAHAADMAARPLYTKAPMVAAIYDWTGFYVGVNAGGGVGRSRTQQNIPGNSFDVFYQQPQGAIGGVQAGYNWQTNMGILGPVLFGLEADIQGADLRDSRTLLGGLIGPSSYNQQIDWFGTARARVGLVTGATVSYVTGGYAYGNVRNSVTEAFGAPGATTFATDRTRGGYALGSGVEAALGGNWTGKIEYLYVDLGNRTDAFTLQGVAQSQTVRIRENIFRAGLNYKIGGAAYNPAPANWTGFYLGGNVGSGTSRNPSSLGAAGVIPDQFSLAPDGYNGGVQVGYNWQASSWVFGLEADGQGAWARDNKTCVALCAPVLNAVYDAKLPWFATARGRLGYSVGSTLFYATGGYAAGGVKTSVTTNVLGAVSQNTISATRSGWTVGGGIETPFTFLGLFGPNWTTKTEYLYVDLGSVTNSFTPAGAVAPVFQSQRVSEHIFRTGLNYHFNSPVVAKY